MLTRICLVLALVGLLIAVIDRTRVVLLRPAQTPEPPSVPARDVGAARAVPVPCEPTLDQVIWDLEGATSGMRHPCWLHEAAPARRVGAMLRAALEAK